MTKKSDRKKIDEYFHQDLDEKKVFKKMKPIVTLLNRCIYHTLLIPQGYYKCFECDSKKVLVFGTKKWRTYKSHHGLVYHLPSCRMCEGRGYIDFVTNATKLQNSQFERGRGISVPCYLLEYPKLEAASRIFYTLYYTVYLHDMGAKFNLNENHDKKTVDEFLCYFSKYKKERDKRKKFIGQNLKELKKQVIKITTLSDIPPHKIACKVCNGQPIDIETSRYNDEINIKICGNCYGWGYQSKRDTKLISNYIFPIDYPNYPKYNSKKEVLKTILATADINRATFALKIGQIEFKDKKRKAA